MQMSKMVASAKIGETLDPQIVALAKLGLSDEEIKQVLADDKRIDKGEKLLYEKSCGRWFMNMIHGRKHECFLF